MASLPEPIVAALNFEKTNFIDGSIADNNFYSVSANDGQTQAGTIIKVQKEVETSKYLLPSATALSRFVYQSESLNGTLVPVSAFVLWPYMPRTQPDGLATVAWAHGTTGFTPECAPSHHKNLWQHFLGPYQLALQGYVVVATDYAGLGVGKRSSGESIVHEYLASPSQANDVVYSMQAAQSAFPELSKDYVIIGHSQGGGTAWAAAQRQVSKPAPGLLGCIAVSPVTTILDLPEPVRSLIGAAVCSGMGGYFPDIAYESILTSEGRQRIATVKELHAHIASASALLLEPGLLQPDWGQNPQVLQYQSLISNGDKQIGCPLLVLHGESDPLLNFDVTTRAVEKTMERFPDSPLEFVPLPYMTHAPAMSASQKTWMDWIADRFAGRKIGRHGYRGKPALARPGACYQVEQSWYLERATQFYMHLDISLIERNLEQTAELRRNLMPVRRCFDRFCRSQVAYRIMNEKALLLI